MRHCGTKGVVAVGARCSTSALIRVIYWSNIDCSFVFWAS